MKSRWSARSPWALNGPTRFWRKAPTALTPQTRSGSAPSGPLSQKSGAPPTASPPARASLHWEVAFPGVWQHWQDDEPVGGFDAVIGNPPWDRIKLQEVEWFATPFTPVGAGPDRSRPPGGIKQLRKEGDPLASKFDAAKLRADRLSKLIGACGHFPLLGGGDINLYRLFVERAMNLIRPDGIVGLLTPSGICGDMTAAKFFRHVSTSGHVGCIFDFENRPEEKGRPRLFPDVDARFKFCVFILGGQERIFSETECASFLQSTDAIRDPERCFALAAADFARVNPNTSTAPVFRTRRDADITRRIYELHPVLVDRTGEEVDFAWPVRYNNMFHMTNDSHLFRTAAELEASGFYPVENRRWKRGDQLYLPLYEGKMVQAFDHRAASVEINPENLNRPAQPRKATLAERSNPHWLPEPHYWVMDEVCKWPNEFEWTVGFKHVASPTNGRSMILDSSPCCWLRK